MLSHDVSLGSAVSEHISTGGIIKNKNKKCAAPCNLPLSAISLISTSVSNDFPRKLFRSPCAGRGNALRWPLEQGFTKSPYELSEACIMPPPLFLLTCPFEKTLQKARVHAVRASVLRSIVGRLATRRRLPLPVPGSPPARNRLHPKLREPGRIWQRLLDRREHRTVLPGWPTRAPGIGEWYACAPADGDERESFG